VKRHDHIEATGGTEAEALPGSGHVCREFMSSRLPVRFADVPKFIVVDSHTVRGNDGREYDVATAIEALPWVPQLCPQMPHEYAHLSKSPVRNYGVLAAMVGSGNPASYRAYFRGYERPGRYWDAPDGRRYWSTGYMLNRCWPDSVEPLRRVDDGAKPITHWDGPPWAPPEAWDLYQAEGQSWWPTAAALKSGYQPCKACRRRKTIADAVIDRPAKLPPDGTLVRGVEMLGNLEDDDYRPRTFTGRLVTRYIETLDYWQVLVDDGANGWIVEPDSIESLTPRRRGGETSADR
jgi:hypothetical protein